MIQTIIISMTLALAAGSTTSAAAIPSQVELELRAPQDAGTVPTLTARHVPIQSYVPTSLKQAQAWHQVKPRKTSRDVVELETRGGAGLAVKGVIKVAQHAPEVAHAAHSLWDKVTHHKSRELSLEDNLITRDEDIEDLFARYFDELDELE